MTQNSCTIAGLIIVCVAVLCDVLALSLWWLEVVPGSPITLRERVGFDDVLSDQAHKMVNEMLSAELTDEKLVGYVRGALSSDVVKEEGTKWVKKGIDSLLGGFFTRRLHELSARESRRNASRVDLRRVHQFGDLRYHAYRKLRHRRAHRKLRHRRALQFGDFNPIAKVYGQVREVPLFHKLELCADFSSNKVAGSFFMATIALTVVSLGCIFGATLDVLPALLRTVMITAGAAATVHAMSLRGFGIALFGVPVAFHFHYLVDFEPLTNIALQYRTGPGLQCAFCGVGLHFGGAILILIGWWRGTKARVTGSEEETLPFSHIDVAGKAQDSKKQFGRSTTTTGTAATTGTTGTTATTETAGTHRIGSWGKPDSRYSRRGKGKNGKGDGKGRRGKRGGEEGGVSNLPSGIRSRTGSRADPN